MTIEEDYVSFEIAKLLKEKGFEVLTNKVYDNQNKLDYQNVVCWQEKRLPYTSAPTHQMAMKWLREVHNIIVIIDYNDDEECFKEHQKYGFTIYSKNLIKVGLELFPTYEEAVEMALKYVLKNLL